MAVFQDPSWRIKKKPCEYYRKGRCIFGQDRCNFLHVMNDWNPDESTIIESQSLSKGLAVNIFPETPPSVRSPPRSPRTTSLLLALKGVIKDEEDEYIDDMSYEAVDDETGVDTQPVNPHSAPPSPAHSVLLSPVEFSDLQLKHFSLLHSGTRDSQQVPFQNSGFYDYGTPPSQWASPSPMNLSPPRSPALSSTFDLLASPFGSPLTRLLPNHAVKSPQIGPFVPRIPVSPSPLSSQCDPSQDEIQPDMDLDSPSEYHRQKLKERAEMVEAEAEVHTATLIAPRIPSDDEDDEDDGEYTGRLTARWDSDDQVTVRPFVLAPAPSPRSKSKVHRDDKLALVREEVDEALRKQSESSSKIFHSPETAQPHPSFNPEDIQADSTAHTPIPSSLGEDVTAQLAYLTQSQSDEFDDEDAVTSPEEDDTIGSLYNAYSDIGSDSERDEEDHYLEETDADGDICVSMSLPIVGSLPGTVKSLPLASLSEDRRVFTPPPRKSMSQSLSMSLPRAPSFPGTVTNLASASLPEDPRVLAPSPRRSTSQSLSMSLPRAPSLTGTVTDSAPASLPEDRRVFTPPPRKSTSQSLSMSLPRAPSLPGTAIDLASASLPEDRRVFTLSPRRSTSQSLSMSLPRAPLLGTVTDSASASSPENPRVFAPSPRRSTSQSLSMSLPRAPLLETAIDSALAEDSRAFAPSPRRSTSQSLSMSLPRAPSFPETITDSAPALLLEDPRVSVLSPGRFTSLPRAHSLPGTVTDSAPAFLPEDPRVFTPSPERLTSQLVAKVFKPPAEESTPISLSNDINDAGDQSVLRSPYRRKKNILRPLTLSMIMTANPLISASSTHADSTISSAPKSPFQSNDHPSSITPINVTSVSVTSDFAASRHSLLSSLLSPPLDSDHAQKATIIPSLSPLSAPPAVTSGEPSGKSSPVRTTTASTIPQPFKRSSIYYIREEATDMPNDTGLSQEPRSAPLAPQTWRGNESKKSSSEKSAGTSVSQRSLSRGSAAISRRSSSAASLSVPQSAHTTSSEIHVRRDLSPSPDKETCPSPHASTPRPALLFAIASDNPEEVERVLECGSNDKAASITANDAIGPQAQSALEFTLENDALKNRLGIVKQLLEFGADPSKAALTQSKPNSESDLDAALKYYLERADTATTRRIDALMQRSVFRPLIRMRYRIIGQDRALEQLYRVLSIYSEKISKSPVVVFLCGPSGHGKSLLAHQFGSLLDIPTHTVNMTTLRTADDIWRSYSISSNDDSPLCTLVEFLANNEGKRCVVVLDEIEKTERNALWSLLVPWELGRCTFEANMRTIDVRNVIWVGTSNIGNSLILDYHKSRKRPGDVFTREEYVELMSSLRPHVSDQLGASVLSRVSAILPFVPFTAEEKRAIASEFLQESAADHLVQGLSKEQRDKVVEDSLKDFVDSEGARSLSRAVSNLLIDSLEF